MTCAEARNIILSGDPAALRDRTDPVLRRHLDACAECDRATSHVVADLALLRRALAARAVQPTPARTPRPAKSFAMSLVPVALAAELALFAFLGNRDAANPLLDRNVVIDDTVTSLLPGNVEIDTGEVSLPVIQPARRPDSASRNDSLARKLAAATQSLRVMSVARQQLLPDGRATLIWQSIKNDTL